MPLDEDDVYNDDVSSHSPRKSSHAQRAHEVIMHRCTVAFQDFFGRFMATKVRSNFKSAEC